MDMYASHADQVVSCYALLHGLSYCCVSKYMHERLDLMRYVSGTGLLKEDSMFPADVASMSLACSLWESVRTRYQCKLSSHAFFEAVCSD